jgi:phosphoribosylaminoimidazole-succinocarboxamide synthase
VLLRFKDSITALDGEKHDVIHRKAEVNAAVSAELFKMLEQEKIPTHFLRLKEATLMQVRRLRMIPVEVVCRNIAAGKLVKSYPFFKHGEKLKTPLVEFFLKDDKRHDPLLSEEHMIASGLASKEEVKKLKMITLKVNSVLRKFMLKRGLLLVDFKIEVGRDHRGTLRVGDELNIDSMRIWDKKTGEVKDKDIYRKGGRLDEVARTYYQSYKLILGRDFK